MTACDITLRGIRPQPACLDFHAKPTSTTAPGVSVATQGDDGFRESLRSHFATLQESLVREHNMASARREQRLKSVVSGLQKENTDLSLRRMTPPDYSQSDAAYCNGLFDGPGRLRNEKERLLVVPSRLERFQYAPAAESEEDIKNVCKGTAGVEVDTDEAEFGEFVCWPEWHEDKHKTFADMISAHGLRPRQPSFSNIKERKSTCDQRVSTIHLENYVFNPTSPGIIVWHGLFMVILAYDLVMIPMAAFEMTGVIYPILHFICSCFWTLDFIIALNLAFYSSAGELITDRMCILKNYAKGWMLPDLLLVTIDWVQMITKALGAGDGNFVKLVRGGKVMKAFRVLRVLRLLRMRKLRDVLQTFDEFVNSQYFTIITSMVVNVIAILMISHFLGCTWYMIGMVDIEGYQTWVKAYKVLDYDWEFQYLTALHWSITQFTPGSMSVQPQNIPERAFAIAVLVVGMIIFSSIVSSITAATNGLKSMNSRYTRQVWLLRRMCREQGIRKDLLSRIMRYSETFVKPKMNKVEVHEIDLISMLPRTLRMEVMLDLYAKHLLGHALFMKMHENRLCLASLCAACLTEVVLDVRVTLFCPGEQARSMYFIVDGVLTYNVWRGHPLRPAESDHLETREMGQGEWFSEAVLWTPWIYQGTMSAHTAAQLIAVDGEHLRRTMVEHRMELVLTRIYAQAYVHGMNELAGFTTETDEDDSNLSDVLAIPAAFVALDNPSEALGSEALGRLSAKHKLEA